TIFDAEFLQARIQVASTNHALDDVIEELARDTDIRLLKDVLELSQPILDALPQELPNQLWGRSQALFRLMRNWAAWDDPHLRLESFTLGKPLAAGERERSHQKVVTTCSFNSTGAKVLSASQDNTVRIWDLETLDP